MDAIVRGGVKSFFKTFYGEEKGDKVEKTAYIVHEVAQKSIEESGLPEDFKEGVKVVSKSVGYAITGASVGSVFGGPFGATIGATGGYLYGMISSGVRNE